MVLTRAPKPPATATAPAAAAVTVLACVVAATGSDTLKQLN